MIFLLVTLSGVLHESQPFFYINCIKYYRQFILIPLINNVWRKAMKQFKLVFAFILPLPTKKADLWIIGHRSFFRR